ncbi:MAG: hypothetical protein KAF91_12145 [Nostoc sp. TH1S01]|nr:hypothetical protein [Nostoc sp. TH1S01]
MLTHILHQATEVTRQLLQVGKADDSRTPLATTGVPPVVASGSSSRETRPRRCLPNALARLHRQNPFG